jgi:glycosyltransferase involved in cell wall biosynthesis
LAGILAYDNAFLTSYSMRRSPSADRLVRTPGSSPPEEGERELGNSPEAGGQYFPSVSIVIPCRNEKDHIEACVRSLLAQERPPHDLEIIIADGLSEDGTRDILAHLVEEDPCLLMIDNPRRIVSTGLNAAIKLARGQVIIRIDVHTEYAPDYIRQCLMVLQETGADNVGGPWLAMGYGYVSRVIAAAFQSAFAIGGAPGHQPMYEGIVDTVYLGSWRREVFERIGLFDEGLVRNQDDEFNLRLTRAGGRIWQSPRIRSWYRPRNSLSSLFRQYLQYGYWKVRVIQKHRLPASIRHLIPGSFVLLTILLPPASLLWSPAGWGWLGMMGVYTIGTLTASLLTASRQGWKLLPLLPLVYACFHFAYGLGFIHGIWHFLVLGREPGHAYTKLSRIGMDHRS